MPPEPRAPLAAAVYERLLSTIARLQACGSIAALGRDGFAALEGLIPAHLVGIIWVPPASDESVSVKLMSKTSPRLRRAQREFERCGHLHPIKKAIDAGRVGEAIRLSDVISPAAWRRHVIYQRSDRPLGHGHTMALFLPAPPQGGLALSFTRKRGKKNFSDVELTLLEKLAPHLAQVLQRLGLGERRVKPWQDPTAGDYLATHLGLGNREAEVLLHLAEGLSNRELGAKLGISDATVRKHLENAYRKLGVRGRHRAAQRVREALG